VLEDMGSGAPASKLPIGYWKFDEGSGTSAKDSSGNGNNLTSMSATWNNSGKIGKALNFTSSNSVSMADLNMMDFGTNDFSISYWGYTRDYTYPKSLVNMHKGLAAYTDGNPGWEFGNSYNATAYSFGINDGTNKVSSLIGLDIGYRPADVQNKWTHYVFSISRTDGKVRLYVNGVKQSSDLNISSVTGSIDNSYGFQIGNVNGWYIDGMVDEVKMYNYALSAADVASDYNQGASVTMASAGISAGAGDNASQAQYCIPGDASTCNAPLAEWNFDEKTGSTVKDISGNGNNASLEGSPSWSTGKIGSAIQLNGTNQRGNGGANISPTYIAIEAWVYRTSSVINQGIVRKNTAYAISLYNNTVQVAPGNNWSFYNTGHMMVLIWCYIKMV
jgi:hypothetical protein